MKGRQMELRELKEKMEAEKLLFSLIEERNVINAVENLSLLVNGVNKPDINSKKEGNTPLIVAISNRRMDLLKVLLDAKADISIKDPRRGHNALELAIANKDKEVLKVLLEYKPDVNAGDVRPLTLAASSGNEEAVKALLDAKAEVNFQEENGNTALMAASDCHYCRINILKTLLNAKADVTKKNINGKTALDLFSSSYQRNNGVKLLLEQAMKEAKPPTVILDEPKKSLVQMNNNEKWHREFFTRKSPLNEQPYKFHDESEHSTSLENNRM